MSTQNAERLAAGLAEDEAAAEFAPANPVLFDSYTEATRFSALHASVRIRRDIAAKRRILALHEEWANAAGQPVDDPSRDCVPAVTEVLGQVIAALAGVYEEAGERQAANIVITDEQERGRTLA